MSVSARQPCGGRSSGTDVRTINDVEWGGGLRFQAPAGPSERGPRYDSLGQRH